MRCKLYVALTEVTYENLPWNGLLMCATNKIICAHTPNTLQRNRKKCRV